MAISNRMTDYFKRKGGGRFANFPTVLLVNRRGSSGSRDDDSRDDDVESSTAPTNRINEVPVPSASSSSSPMTMPPSTAATAGSTMTMTVSAAPATAALASSVSTATASTTGAPTSPGTTASIAPTAPPTQSRPRNRFMTARQVAAAASREAASRVTGGDGYGGNGRNGGRGGNRAAPSNSINSNFTSGTNGSNWRRTGSRRSSSMGRSTVTTTIDRTGRRRLQRGWWPTAELEEINRKRGEIRLKAMEDLKEETFVVTEEHLEWVFEDEVETPQDVVVDEHREASEMSYFSSGGLTEPQCYLVLPTDLTKLLHCCSINGNVSVGTDGNAYSKEHIQYSHCSGKISNECAICMLEYDIGDVLVCSRNCGHAFHQDCVLDWFSREKTQCPSCRATFWDPKEIKKTAEKGADACPSRDDENNEEETANGNNDSNIPTNRPRGDTEDMSVTSDSQSISSIISNLDGSVLAVDSDVLAPLASVVGTN